MAKSRADIDKDMMYRKIMPTTARNGRGSAAAGADNGTGGVADAREPGGGYPGANTISGSGYPGMEGGSGVSGNSKTHTETMSPERPRSSFGLQLPESQDAILVNLMEDLVLSRLDNTLLRFNCCKCNKCKKDIAAIALNKLTPRYVVMRRDDTAKKKQAELDYGPTVTGALVQAIMLVKKEPRH